MNHSINMLVGGAPWLVVISLSLLGLTIGSFINVVSIRIPNGISIISPPSHCVHCNHRLHWIELIPIFGYFSLKGKCKACKTKISPKYPLYEALSATLFVGMGLYWGISSELGVSLLLVSVLLIIVQTDLSERIIPDLIVLPGMAIAAALRTVFHPLPLWDYFLAFFIGGIVLLLVSWIGQIIWKKEVMGGGDIKLFAFLGLILGTKLTLFTFFLSCLLGTIYFLLTIPFVKYSTVRYIPFGPFIAIAAIIAYLLGDLMIDYYLKVVWGLY